MPQQIQDGTGNAYIAKVNSSNRLSTESITLEKSANASFTGDSYNINTGVITLTSASKSAVFYMKNNETTKDLVIDTLVYLIGNSTGGTGDMLITVLRNPTTGTIISSPVTMEIPGVNRNFSSSKTITGDFLVGAEAKTITDGDKVIESIFNQSATRAAIGVGAIILSPGTSIGIEMTPATSNTNVDVEFAASVFLVNN
jgi:hypothetical protein